MSSIADDADIISTLPDTVLCHILSLLPTNDAVATGILSKRWVYLWRQVPTLKIYSMIVDDREEYFRFNEFVYSVLLYRDSVKSCMLDIFYEDPDLGHLGFPNVVKWIDAVVQRGVERLSVSVAMNGGVDHMKLPVSITRCRTLVYLYFLRFNAKGFSSVRLSSLKILVLEDCKFLNARVFLLLLAGCPILENLYTAYSEFDSQESLSYQECESLRLSKLTKVQMPGTFCHFPLKALHNVEELYIEINKVYRSFDVIPTFHKLTKMKLYSINSNWNLLVQVLNHCPNLQNVELSQGLYTGHGIGDNVQENWVDPILVPPCLLSRLKICKLWRFLGKKGELLLAKYILKNARVLQTMTICCPDEELKEESELSLYPRASPTCELIIRCQCRL